MIFDGEIAATTLYSLAKASQPQVIRSSPHKSGQLLEGREKMTASTSGHTSGASAAAPAAGSPPGQAIMQLATGYMGTAALYAATKLGIPDILKSGTKPTSEIARACKANEDAVYRVMRALASAGIFTEGAPRTFALTPEGETADRGAVKLARAEARAEAAERYRRGGRRRRG